MTETNTVPTVYQHWLETYDGLVDPDDLDYGNIVAQRGSWKVGRQIIERKNGAEYLREFAKQTATVIYPTVSGKRGIKAWYEDQTSTATHDKSVVKEILDFDKTPLSKVYNDFKLNYSFNPGIDGFDNSLYITHTDEAAFPSTYESAGTDEPKSWTDSAVSKWDDESWHCVISFPAKPTWAEVGGYISLLGDNGFWVFFGKITFVGQFVGSGIWYISVEYNNSYGLSEGQTESSGTLYLLGSSVPKWQTYCNYNDYVTAKEKWDICKAAYDETQVVNRYEVDCHWFIDNAEFDDVGGDNNTVFKLMNFLVEWATQQKPYVDYLIDLNSTNIQLEMYNFLTFNDAKETNGDDRTGWIEKKKIIRASGKMQLRVILKPLTLVESGGLIIETGSGTVVEESGSQPDVIEETGV